MTTRRSVAARVLASYVLVLMVFAMTAVWSVASEQRSAQEAELLRTGYVPLKFSIERALEAQNLVSAELNHITEAKNPSDARSWIETERRARPKTFAEIRAVTRGFEPTRASAAAMGVELVRDADEIERYLHADAEKFARLFEALSVGDAETANKMQNELVSYEVEGARRIRELRDRVDREIDELVAAARVRERRSIAVLVGLSITTLLVGVGVSLYARRVLKPLAAVTDRAKAVARGDLTPHRLVATNDEIGELAATFEGMVAAIAKASTDLVQAERLAAIGKMAAHVTHEIRNPLNGIEGFASLLARDLPEGDPKRRYAKLIVEGVRNLNRTVTGLLEFTKPCARSSARSSGWPSCPRSICASRAGLRLASSGTISRTWWASSSRSCDPSSPAPTCAARSTFRRPCRRSRSTRGRSARRCSTWCATRARPCSRAVASCGSACPPGPTTAASTSPSRTTARGSPKTCARRSSTRSSPPSRAAPASGSR